MYIVHKPIQIIVFLMFLEALQTSMFYYRTVVWCHNLLKIGILEHQQIHNEIRTEICGSPKYRLIGISAQFYYSYICICIALSINIMITSYFAQRKLDRYHA